MGELTEGGRLGSPIPEAARAELALASSVLVFTGAGMSAESGVPTFRGDGGLWRNHKPEELATPQAFARDPCLVWEWYDWRRRLVLGCAPHEGHNALAVAQAAGRLSVVTQNVDGLHERALQTIERAGGTRGIDVPTPEDTPPDRASVTTLHGSLFRIICTRCPFEHHDEEPIDASSEDTLPRCPDCGALLRPGVVWFGESLDPETLSTAFGRAMEADLCLVVGTSAVVEPAASIPRQVLASGGSVIEVNTESTPLTTRATYSIPGRASRVLPRLLEGLGER